MVRIIENYTLYEIIGEGAYGKVYRAINKNDNKQYAVKVIQVRRFKDNKKLEECTVNEINILSNIQKNQHIIKYIDMLKTPNNFYFVYEYCNGGTLQSILKKEHLISQKQALLFFKQLLDAFQVLNKYNIMHRDLKPDNIFFNNGVVKLGDFGFCKSLQKANMTKTMLGSPIYMAPEILRGQIYSTKADIWSLGVVLYQMLYGFCPFQSTTIPKLIEVLKQTQLQFPQTEKVSEQTKKLMQKLLTKDPTRRIEWMQLLHINITIDGILQNNSREKLFSMTQNYPNILESTKFIQASKVDESMQTNTAPKRTEQNIKIKIPTEQHQNSMEPQSAHLPTIAFLKKKKNTEFQKRKTEDAQEIKNDDNEIKKKISKEHSLSMRSIQIGVDLIKSNSNYGCLFAYLLLKKTQQRLINLREQIGGTYETKEIVRYLNMQLKDISNEVSKYNITDNWNNWKTLIKNTGEFHRNYRAFYMMIVYLADQPIRQDLTHNQMQNQVRNKLY